MFRLIYPELARYHCNPHKNGGLRRLAALCLVVIVFVYGIQTTLVSRSSAALQAGSSTDAAVGGRLQSSSVHSAGNDHREVSPEDRCRLLSSTAPCDEPYFPYRISVGYSDRPPQICWNMHNIPLSSARPGTVTTVELSVADGSVINEKSLSVDSPKNLANFLAHLRSTHNDSYIVMVTWEAVPFSPTLLSHLKAVGTLVNPKFQGEKLEFFLLGQKGLLPGRGISDVQLFNSSLALDRSGCVPPLASSLGSEVDHEFVNSNPGYLVAGEYKVGSSLADCGLPKPCEGGLLPVHIYTGKDHNDPPKLCINGTYVFENRINNGGRGMNIAVIDGFTGVVLRVANYDTWGTDSTMMEVFLEDLQPNEIAIVFTHDEATTKLSELSRTLFFELGSSRIHDLKFRAAWYMIGQKGIKGFTGFERLNIGEKTNWAEMIDERICLPRRLSGYLTRPDPLPETRNIQRLTFCKRHRSYGDFCAKDRALAPLIPAKLADVTLVNSPIYSDLTAVLLAGGTSHNAVRIAMETLLGQPGVNPRQVRVVSRHHNDSAMRDLVSLFNFHFYYSEQGDDYNKFLRNAIQETLDEYRPRYIVVIEENTVLSPDFLHLLASLEPLFEADPTINAISAWNDNGYNETSGDLSRVYRIEGIPQQGFLTTRAFWEATVRGSRCCAHGSLFPDQEFVVVVPDVSRIARIPVVETNTSFAYEMFVRPREFSRQSEVKVDNNFPVIKERYDPYLTSHISQGAKFYFKSRSLCDAAKDFAFTVPKQQAVILMINQGHASEKLWYQICRCFGLFAVDGMPPRGRYNDTLSFSYAEPPRLVVVVGMDSPFRVAALKPSES